MTKANTSAATTVEPPRPPIIYINPFGSPSPEAKYDVEAKDETLILIDMSKGKVLPKCMELVKVSNEVRIISLLKVEEKAKIESAEIP